MSVRYLGNIPWPAIPPSPYPMTAATPTGQRGGLNLNFMLCVREESAVDKQRITRSTQDILPFCRSAQLCFQTEEQDQSANTIISLLPRGTETQRLLVITNRAKKTLKIPMVWWTQAQMTMCLLSRSQSRRPASSLPALAVRGHCTDSATWLLV